MHGGGQPEQAEQSRALEASGSTISGHHHLLQLASARNCRRWRSRFSWTPQVATTYLSLFWGGFGRSMDRVYGAPVRKRRCFSIPPLSLTGRIAQASPQYQVWGTTTGGALDRLGLVPIDRTSTQDASHTARIAYRERFISVDGSDASADFPAREKG